MRRLAFTLSWVIFAVVHFNVLQASSPTAAPVYVPSYAPTNIPTPVVSLAPDTDPIAKHQLVVVPATGNQVIHLSFYDATTTKLSYYVTSTPESGILYQLSQVFSNYGYEPKNGAKFSSSGNTKVTGSHNRVYYTRPSPDVAGVNKWGTFNFYVMRDATMLSSYHATVTLVPPSGALVGSNFLLSSDDWIITGNKQPISKPSHEPFSRGQLLNYYISGFDDLINVESSSSPDQSLWYFEAPPRYYGNQGIAYGGFLSFTISSFSGDFSSLNAMSSNVVELECSSCVGPVRQGIRLGFSMAALAASSNGMFKGQAMKITIALNEHGGWTKDSQDVLVPWKKASQCDVIQVLSRLSKIRILGDYTTWYETVAIDNVQISNTKGQLPLCALEKADASICTC